jgi:hypothetical protein
MNTNHAMKLGFAMMVAAAPLGVKATTGPSALEACADAVVSGMTESGSADLSYRLDESSTDAGRRRKGSGMYHLDVRDPDSREVIARADCRFNRQAEVILVKTIPLNAADARVRARKY